MTSQPTLFDTTLPTPPIAISTSPRNWLTDHLIRTGHLTETGLSRRARIRICPTCHQPTLAALDDDTCAFETHCDPHPLNPLGEALALVEGRRTLALHRTAGHWELDRRDHRHITDDPASHRHREDVLRQHRCHTPPIPNDHTAPSRFPETNPPLPPGAAPPF